MKSKGLPYEIGHSKYHKHALELVKDAVERGYRSIFALGGDGTVFEVVNALAATGKADEVSIGFLPGGTGNDFTRSLDCPRDPVEAFERLRTGKTIELDVWKANHLYFINVFGLGLDTDLDGWARRTKKLLSGMPAYIAALILTLFSFQFKKIRITAGGQEMEREVVVLTASNGRYYGGGILVAPHAKTSDGLLDLVVINKVARVFIPFLLAKYIAGRHIEEVKQCEYIRAERISIDTSMQFLCETDGELELTAPITIERADWRLTAMVPADYTSEVG